MMQAGYPTGIYSLGSRDPLLALIQGRHRSTAGVMNPCWCPGGILPGFHPNFTLSVRQEAFQAWKPPRLSWELLLFSRLEQQQCRDPGKGLAGAPSTPGAASLGCPSGAEISTSDRGRACPSSSCWHWGHTGSSSAAFPVPVWLWGSREEPLLEDKASC